MNVATLKKLDELIAVQTRSNELLELLLKNSDVTRRLEIVGNSGVETELINISRGAAFLHALPEFVEAARRKHAQSPAPSE